jgi:hypothetical protein
VSFPSNNSKQFKNVPEDQIDPNEPQRHKIQFLCISLLLLARAAKLVNIEVQVFLGISFIRIAKF